MRAERNRVANLMKGKLELERRNELIEEGAFSLLSLLIGLIILHDSIQNSHKDY